MRDFAYKIRDAGGIIIGTDRDPPTLNFMSANQGDGLFARGQSSVLIDITYLVYCILHYAHLSFRTGENRDH
jgi:hypothetical protein